MRLALFTHEVSLEHDTGWGHPERPARVPAVLEGIRSAEGDIVELDAPEADPGDIARIHDEMYMAAIERFCAQGGGSLDADTVARGRSWEAAVRAAGAGPAAADRLRQGGEDVGWVVMRPPGHHALRARAMGFCLFNNVAITAARLVEQGERVAIVDWDVHHGNGTQDVFYDSSEVLYVSLHESPAYPGTGAAYETGVGEGAGTNINFPWPAGTDGTAYRWAMRRIVRPVLERFAPDWVLVSSGFDAHVADPLAGIRLVGPDYGAMAGMLRGSVADARTIFFLEGGYDLGALRESAAATVTGFAGSGDAGGDPHAEAMPEAGRPAGDMAAAVLDAVRRRWDI